MDRRFIIGDDYRDPKHGCLAVIVAAVLTVLCCVFFSGCKTVQPLTQSSDSVRVEVRHDSVYVYQHHSIYRDRWRAAPPVFVPVETLHTL